MDNNFQKSICGAKTRAGTPCKNSPMPNGRCRFHGGLSLGGYASPAFKHGKYSKYVPARLLDSYEEALGDPELLALDDELALARSRLIEQLENVDTKESGIHWKRFGKIYDDLLSAVRRQDTDAMARHLNTMGEAIRRANSYWATWADIFSLVEVVRRVSDTETKRREKMSLMIHREEALTLVEAIGALIIEYVPKEQLPDANRRLMGLLHRTTERDN